MGVGRFEETDVYAGARVFTGWNLASANRSTAQARYEFVYNAAQHDTAAKDFSFPIYADGGATIPARSPATACRTASTSSTPSRAHPETGPRLARKLYAFFVNEVDAPDAGARSTRSRDLLRAADYEIAPMVRTLLLSPQFQDPANYYKRYSWPAEFVVRAMKEVGWTRLLGQQRADAAVNMGQQLFEPPDVNGWDARAGLVLERRDARAHELRRDAGHQSAVQPARYGARQVDSPEALCRSCSTG